MTSLAQTTFAAAFEIAPIWLVGGLADYLGGYAPITLLTEMMDIPGIENGEFFAHYKPLPGSSLAKWKVAEYPFANFATAANAVVQEPLDISMLMVCPAQTGGGLIIKQAILTALQFGIQKHITTGGTFTVLTPAFAYANCLLTNIRDITPPADKQVQYMYQWDFTQPLITSSQAQSVLGTLMNKVSNGLPTTATWTQSPSATVPTNIDFFAD
jgi:hypothetical protein